MSYLDIVFAIPIIWLCVRGFIKGFIIEIASLIALVLGVYAAFHFSVFTSGLLINNLGLKGEYIPILSFIITFIAVIILVFVLAKIIEGFANIVMLSLLNKLGGAFIGIIKAVIALGVIVYMISSYDKEEFLINKETKQKSLLYSPIFFAGSFVMKKADITKLFVKDVILKEEKNSKTN